MQRSQGEGAFHISRLKCWNFKVKIKRGAGGMGLLRQQSWVGGGAVGQKHAGSQDSMGGGRAGRGKATCAPCPPDRLPVPPVSALSPLVPRPALCALTLPAHPPAGSRGGTKAPQGSGSSWALWGLHGQLVLWPSSAVLSFGPEVLKARGVLLREPHLGAPACSSQLPARGEDGSGRTGN